MLSRPFSFCFSATQIWATELKQQAEAVCRSSKAGGVVQKSQNLQHTVTAIPFFSSVYYRKMQHWTMLYAARWMEQKCSVHKKYFILVVQCHLLKSVHIRSRGSTFHPIVARPPHMLRVSYWFYSWVNAGCIFPKAYEITPPHSENQTWHE